MLDTVRCPRCSSSVQADVVGDLLAYNCASCGWQDQVTVGRTFPEMPRAQVVAVVVRKTGAVAAEAFAALRSAGSAAKAISLSELHSQLASPAGFNLGVQALHRAISLQASLAALGFEVHLVAQENAVQPVAAADGFAGR